MTKYVALFCAALMGVWLCTGCSPKVVDTKPEVVAPPPVTQESDADRASRGKTGDVSEEELARAERDRLARSGTQDGARERESLFRDIRFEYDSYTIRQEDVGRLKDVGAWLSRNRNARVSVEGHCDERGTQEYNLMLGQKRADVVKDYLIRLGVDEKRIKAISYGKEQPLDPSHTEEAWAANRRVHFNVDTKG